MAARCGKHYALDPICGMTVDEAIARSVEPDGRKVYFFDGPEVGK